MFEYRAKLVKVVDGDTIDLDIDLGFNIHIRERVRLYGVNTPEVRGSEKKSGMAAKAFVKWWLQVDKGPIMVRTVKDKRGKFGRMLAILFHESDMLERHTKVEKVGAYGDFVGGSLNQDLLDKGFAKEYYGGKK